MPRQEAGEPYYRIGVDEAAQMYDHDDVAFVDVRRPDEYAAGHIKNACSYRSTTFWPASTSCPKKRDCSSSAPRACAAGWPARWRPRWA